MQLLRTLFVRLQWPMVCAARREAALVKERDAIAAEARAHGARHARSKAEAELLETQRAASSRVGKRSGQETPRLIYILVSVVVQALECQWCLQYFIERLYVSQFQWCVK